MATATSLVTSGGSGVMLVNNIRFGIVDSSPRRIDFLTKIVDESSSRSGAYQRRISSRVLVLLRFHKALECRLTGN